MPDPVSAEARGDAEDIAFFLEDTTAKALCERIMTINLTNYLDWQSDNALPACSSMQTAVQTATPCLVCPMLGLQYSLGLPSVDFGGCSWPHQSLISCFHKND